MMPISINIQKAGALEEKIKGYSSKNIQYLQLVGFINESDIEVIDSLKELTILDISNAQIVVDGTQNDIIGDRMFSECCFSSITLPNGIRSIGKQAFRYGKLTNITIPDSTVVIGRLAFLFCSNLETVTMGKGVQIIGNNAFAHCEKIQSIIIPEKVTSIGGAAFRNCCNLEEIKVKGQIKFIGKGAFGNCSKLSRIYSEQFIPLSYEMFDEDNIHSCSIYIQGKKYSILDYINQISFDQKSFSTFLPIAGSLKHITFYSCGIQELKLAGFINGDDVLAIREWHFSRFRNLDLSNVQIVEGGSAYYEERRSISRGASLRTQIFKHVTNCNEIGPYMFCNCSFYRIILPKESVSIRNRAFENCSNLETIIIGENVEEIGDKAFYRCTKLSQINIPNGVKKVYSHAFGDCSNLISVTLGENVEYLGEGVFENCDSLSEIRCKGTHISIDCLLKAGVNIDKCKLYFDNSKTLTFEEVPINQQIHVPTAGKLKEIIGNTQKEIIQVLKLSGYLNGDDIIIVRSLIQKYNLTILDIADVTFVSTGGAYGYYAYNKTIDSLDFIHYTDSMSEDRSQFISFNAKDEIISAHMFEGCNKLLKIVLPDNIYRIESCAFEGCRKLNRIEIPDNVVQIQEGTFSECINLERITIGKNVRNISKDAFAGCKKIAAIYCKGLPPQIDETFFENIDISNCKLYAKSCYLNDYKNDRYWKLFIKEEKKVESKSTYYTINECLTPITMFDDFFKRHQNEFIYQKGRKQYDDLYDKIRKASKLKELCRMSIQYGVAPNAEDFKIVAMFGSTWFGFNQKLTRMGALIALKIWDETVNMEKQLASDIALYNKAQSIIRITS